MHTQSKEQQQQEQESIPHGPSKVPDIWDSM